jgi:hypothetical protein
MRAVIRPAGFRRSAKATPHARHRFFAPKNPRRALGSLFWLPKIAAEHSAPTFGTEKPTPSTRHRLLAPKNPRRALGTTFLLPKTAAERSAAFFGSQKLPPSRIAPLFTTFYGKSIKKGEVK